MNRSIRCKHGFCLESMGCETCGVKVSPMASAHLRRVEERRTGPRVPNGYTHADGKRFGQGNANAKTRTGERA